MFCGQDYEKYLEQMRAGQAPNVSNAFHVCMRDSAGVPLHIEMFCVRFLDLDGKQAHFVGLREFSDSVSPSSLMRQRQLPRQEMNTEFPLLVHVEDRAPVSEVSDVYSDVSSDTGAGAMPEVEAQIDIFSDKYKVTNCSASFLVFCELPLKDVMFLTWISKGRHLGFINWVEASYQKLCDTYEGVAYSQSNPSSFTRVVYLHPPKLRPLCLYIRAVAEISLSPEPSVQGEESDESTTAQLTLRHIDWLQDGAASSRREERKGTVALPANQGRLGTKARKKKSTKAMCSL